MSRTAHDPAYREAFAGRLRKVLDAQPVGLPELAATLGYKDDTTLRAAIAARSQLDLDRLAKLAAWAQSDGHPIDLHWLLTGTLATADTTNAMASWLTPERIRALKLLAEAAPSLPEQGAQVRGTSSQRSRRRRTPDSW